VADPLLDRDGDGLTDLLQLATGGDPLVPSASPICS